MTASLSLGLQESCQESFVFWWLRVYNRARLGTEVGIPAGVFRGNCPETGKTSLTAAESSMRRTRMLALAVCLCLPLQLSAGVPPGSVTDPDNDALPSPNEDPDPDLVSASVTSDGTDLHLSVRLKAGTFDQALTAVRFYFDTDQDPSTGNPGTNLRPCDTDTDNIGPDFLLDMGPNTGTAGLLLRLRGCSLFDTSDIIILEPDVTSPLGTATITFVADGIDAVLPLALLDGDDGLLNFKVRMSELVIGGFSGTLDTMPDVGLPAAMSAIAPVATTITGVFNAATSVPEDEPGHAVAPGSAVAIFGEGFASHLASPSPVPLSSQQIPLDTTLGDLTATVDGIPMPLFGVFRGEDSGVGFDQFNGQLPWEVLATPEKTEATLIIISNGVSSVDASFSEAKSLVPAGRPFSGFGRAARSLEMVSLST